MGRTRRGGRRVLGRIGARGRRRNEPGGRPELRAVRALTLGDCTLLPTLRDAPGATGLAPGTNPRAAVRPGGDQDLSADPPADAPAFDPVESVEADELSALDPSRSKPLEPLEPAGAVDELDASVRAESADVPLPFPDFEPLLDEELLRESVL